MGDSYQFDAKKDVAKYLDLVGIKARPQAADGLLYELMKIDNTEYKVRYMQKFTILFKEW
jgi:hypothetical protein